MRNKLTLVIVALIAIPLLAIGALYLFVNPERLKPVVETQISQALRRPTSIGTLAFSVFPPSFGATGLTIADDPAFSNKAFLTAKSLEIRPSLLPLLSGNVEIQSLRVVEPKVELLQNAAKKWNYESIGKSSEAPGSSTMRLSRLNVDNASVGVTKAGDDRDEYSQISAEVRDFETSKPFYLQLAARLPEGESISVQGTIQSEGPKTTLRDTSFTMASLKGKIDGDIAGEAINLKVQIPPSPFADLAPLFLPKGMSVKGQLAADITATGSTAAPVLNGRVDVTGFEVSGGDIKQPVRTPKLELALSPELIKLEEAEIVSGSTHLRAAGTVSNYSAAPVLDARVYTNAAQLQELLAIARAYGVSAVQGIDAKGQANLQIGIKGSLKAKAPMQFTGSGMLNAASIQLPSLSKPLAIQTTSFRFEENSAALTNIDATLGSTTAKGDMKVDNFKRPNIQFNLQANKVVLDEIRSLIKEEKAASKSSDPPKLTAKGTLAIDTMQLADLTLTKLNAQASYDNGRITLSPLNASLYGGRHSGTMDIDMRANPPLYTMDSKLEKIESSTFLAAATAVKGVISGPFSANLKLKFTPNDPVQMARSLNGNVSLKFDQGRIASLNLVNELAAIGKFFGFNPPAESFTQFLGISGDLALVNGTANTQNLKLDLSNLTASLTGSMNLTDQTLNMKLLSVLDKKFSELVGGNKIGGFMSVALANANGNLLIPASITGTFAKPKMSPDTAAMAKLKLNSFNPKDPKQMMDNVNNLLDMFKKKKPADEKP